MNHDSSRRLSRRQSLALLSGALVTLAGCTGNGEGGDGGTPEPTDTQTATSTPTETDTPTASPTPTATAAPEADATIAAGPNGALVFEPARLRISVGDTVAWEFVSAGHNVSGRPQDHPDISIPEGAEPFASYSDGNKYTTEPPGTTYTHTFETAGEYTYVCIPHAAAGMIGHLTVR